MTKARRTYLVTGASGQDGGYLVRRLLEDGQIVHGMCHTAAGAERLAAELPDLVTHVGDLASTSGIRALVDEAQPDIVVNLAGNSSVARSWQFPVETADVIGIGALRLLESSWQMGLRADKEVRFIQASSAEIFGDTEEAPQSESTARKPITPYGAAKSFAHEMVTVYRKRGMFASSAILYNHESPQHPESFVARKITKEVARISLGLSASLVLGNIGARRDWGFAPDYVDAMLRISHAEQPDDYIVATGAAHTVRDFVIAAFAHIGVADWERYVEIDPALYRPADPKQLVGNPAKLKTLGWRPTVDFYELVADMVDADIRRLTTAIADAGSGTAGEGQL